MNKRVLVVTEEYDPHSDIVCALMNKRGIPFLRFHPHQLPLNGSLMWHNERALTQGWVDLGDKISFEEITSVWWRRPKKPELPPLPQEEAKFARMELFQAMQGFWASLDCFWMSRPELITVAEWKPLQLKRASELGLRTPKTLITTSPEALLGFFGSCNERVIYKVLSSITLGLDSPTMATKTTLLDRSTISELSSGVRHVPCLFQEYIEKAYELRVTIIGDDIFVAEIDSQAQEETSVDWREYSVPMKMRKGHLPDKVAQQCYALMKKYGLNFSAIDLIVTKEGEYVFLENNPNGQFLFVEQWVPELKMADALLGCLWPQARVRPNNPQVIA